MQMFFLRLLILNEANTFLLPTRNLLGKFFLHDYRQNPISNLSVKYSTAQWILVRSTSVCDSVE